MKTEGARKWWVLAALSFGLMAVGLDMTVLNVALPTLAVDLQASTSELQWMANAYNLVLAAALLPAGMIGDRYGRKRCLILSLILFGAASIACALSDSAEMLIAMRAFLGLGAAFLIPLSMSVLPVLFKDEERSKAMTVWATANMLGIPLGPIIGGWLLQHYAWGSVFLLNIPFVLIALAAVSWLMPESRSEARHRFDLPGIFTSSIGLVGITYGVTRAGERGWDDPASLVLFAVGIVMVAVFIYWQARAASPLIELSLFRYRSFTWGSILATLVSFALFGLLFTLPLFFQAVGGADTLGTGLRLLPLIGGLIVGAKAADRLLTAAGANRVAAAGFAVMAAGLLLGCLTNTASGFGFVALWITISGAGLGLTLPTVMTSALGQLTAERSGVGSALIMAMRQVGGAIGIALLGSAMNSSYRGSLRLDGFAESAAEAARQSVSAGVAAAGRLGSAEMLEQVQQAFVHGMSTMLWVCGGIALAGVLLTLRFLPRQNSLQAKSEVNL